MRTQLYRAHVSVLLVLFVAGGIYLHTSAAAFAATDQQGNPTDTQDKEKAADEKEPSYRDKSLSQWIEDLSHKSRSRRLHAIRAVTALKKQAGPAVPKLIDIIKTNTDLVCCRYAVTALGAIGHNDETVIDVLLESLQHDDAAVRQRATSGLADLSPLPDSALATVVGLLADEDARMQYSAARILYHAEKVPPELLQKVESAVRKSSGGTRMYLALCLGTHRRVPVAAIPGLIDALKLQDSTGRMLGRRLVGTHRDHRETRRRAAAAMTLIGPESKDAVPVLIEALKYRNVVQHESFIFGTRRTEDRSDVVRKPAADALIRIGPAAVPTLREAAQDADLGIRDAVAMILHRIAPDDLADKPILPAQLISTDVVSIVRADLRRLESKDVLQTAAEWVIRDEFASEILRLVTHAIDALKSSGATGFAHVQRLDGNGKLESTYVITFASGALRDAFLRKTTEKASGAKMIVFSSHWKWSPLGDRFIASGAQPKHVESAKPNPAIRKLLDDLRDSAFVMVAVPNERLRRMYKRARAANNKKESEFEKLGAEMLTELLKASYWRVTITFGKTPSVKIVAEMSDETQATSLAQMIKKVKQNLTKLTEHSEAQDVPLIWYKSVFSPDVASAGHRVELVYGQAKLAAIVQLFINSP